VIILKREKLETQLAILEPRRGHALKNYKEKLDFDTTDPDLFSEWNEKR
jgi:hypothetical protein